MIKTFIFLMILLSAGFLGARYVFADAMRKYFGPAMYLSLVAIMAAGFFVHDAALFLVIAGVALLATVSSRMDALCRLVVMVAVLPPVTYFLSAGGTYLLELRTWEALSIAAWLACMFRPGALRHRRVGAEDALVVILILSNLAGAREASFTGLWRELFTDGLGLALPFFLYSRFVHDRAEFSHVVGALAGAAMILAVVAIYEAKGHWSLYFPMINDLARGGAMNEIKMRAGFMRAPVSFTEPTSFALFEMVGVFAVVSSRPLFRSRLLWSGSIALTILGLLAGQSRGADLGLLVGLFLLLAVRRRYALAAAIAASGAMIVALMLVLASSSSTIASLIGADSRTGTVQDYRQGLLSRGLEVGMQHPIFGDGRQHVMDQLTDIMQGERIVDFVNSYLTIFLNSGMVGFFIAIALIVIIFVQIFQIGQRKIYEANFNDLPAFLVAALGSVLLAIFFTSLFERNAYWLMVILAGSRMLGVTGQSPSFKPLKKLAHTAGQSAQHDEPVQVPG